MLTVHPLMFRVGAVCGGLRDTVISYCFWTIDSKDNVATSMFPTQLQLHTDCVQSASPYLVFSCKDNLVVSTQTKLSRTREVRQMCTVWWTTGVVQFQSIRA